MKHAPISIDRNTVRTVLGWKKDTPLQFKKGAKRGDVGNSRKCGGREAETAEARYKTYSRGKTVAEAMELGAMKADLIFDLHCGNVRASGSGRQAATVKRGLVKKTAFNKTVSAKAAKAEDWSAPDYVKEKKGGSSCHDETYLTIARWQADTKIRYKPHAKAPGSKSHLRYEIYSLATTVGEALALGSYPADWCWDYERGFIKVDESTTREEPLCPGEDESDFTEVDRTVMRWWKVEMARVLGKTVKELSDDVGKYESLVMHMKRTVANKKAKKVLDECIASPARKVGDEDVVTVLRAWPFKKNTTRLNVMRDGQTWVHSDTVGIIPTRDGRLLVTPPTSDYPDVMRLLNRYLRDHMPADLGMKTFPFTSININKAYNGRLHRDGNNVGPSMLKAFGDFHGGKLYYFPNDDRTRKVEELPIGDRATHDVGRNLVLFDGRRGHEVTNFTGERYSLVWFTAPRCQKLSAPGRKALKDRYFNFPTPADTKKSLKLLLPPQGYAARASPAGAAGKSRAWPIKGTKVSKVALKGSKTKKAKRHV